MKASSVKIAVVTPAYPPHQGGLEVVTDLLVRTLRERGNIVDVYFPPEIRHSWSVFGGPALIETIKEIPDIFHVQQCDLSVRYASLLKRRFPEVPVVTSIHGMFRFDPAGYCRVRWSPTEPARQLIRILPGKYYEARSVRDSDYLITPSSGLEDVCREIRGDSNVSTIPNGIDLRQFTPREDGIEASARPVILCPGRIYSEKGQMTLVEAMPEILASVDATVCFAGDQDPAYYRKLQELASTNGTTGNIRFAGARPYPEMPGIYRKADIVVVPSLSETFGMAILENMAMGNVVVATRTGAVPDLVEDGKTGLLVPPNNPRALAEAIIRGLTDTGLRQSIRKNAPEKAAGFDIRTTTERIESVYRSLL